MKIRVPIAGTIGKSVQFDPDAGARAEAAVAALATQISAGLGGNIRHSALQGLQIGDDHPQYTGNAFPETITGQWNFGTIPLIQGATLAEYIEDVVGGSFFDFLQDTTSVVWTYHDTAQELEANVPPEFVQDTVGAMLVDTATVDFTYDDTLGQISAVVPGAALTKTDDTNVTLTLGGAPATALARAASLALGWTGQLAVSRGGSGAGTLTGYLKGNGTAAFTAVSTIPYSDISGTPSIPAAANPSGLIGMTAVNGSAPTFGRSDATHAINPAIAPTWSAQHIFSLPGSHLASAILLSSSSPALAWYTASAAADEKLWDLNSLGGSVLALRAKNDAGTISRNAFTMFRSGVALTDLEFGNSTDFPNVAFYGNMRLPSNTKELQLGLSQKFRQYFDGVDCFVRADAGILKLLSGSVSILEVTATRGTFNVPFSSKAYTVATLPAGAQGDRAHVTDALAPTFLAVVVGGGAVVTPVFHNGANWVAQ